PESCKIGNITILPEDIPIPTDNSTSNNNQTNEEQQTNVGGSFEYMGIVGIAAGVMVLLLITLLIMRVRKPSKGKDEMHTNLEAERPQAMVPILESLQAVEQTAEVEQVTESEYEWLEHPEGSGYWYYRNPGDEDWIYYEQ
ncbi:MAG: hypothetical protein QF807_01725, partial [Candidatus Thalassarchaeaceae archaeon]|nr:hypothetical protein [Candidatus Thalassarchaeaceae archaeon]